MNNQLTFPFMIMRDQDVNDFDKVQSVNVLGVFLGLKHVLLVMIEDNSDDSSFVTGAQYRVHDGMAAQ